MKEKSISISSILEHIITKESNTTCSTTSERLKHIEMKKISEIQFYLYTALQRLENT
jgi:hypothetical protein